MVAESKDILMELNSVNISGYSPSIDTTETVDDIDSLKLQLTDSITSSITKTSLTEADNDVLSSVDIGDMVYDSVSESLLAAVEVPATLATGMAGMAVSGAEAAGRLVLGAIDSDFYPEESGYEGFIDLMEKRQAQITHNPEGDYTKAIFKGLAWAMQPIEDAIVKVGEVVGYDAAQAVGIDNPTANASIATGTLLLAEVFTDVLTGTVLKTSAKVAKIAKNTTSSVSGSLLTPVKSFKEIRNNYVKKSADKILDDWAIVLAEQTDILEALESAQVIQKSIPGFEFDLAEASQSNVLRGIKKDLVNKFDPAQKKLINKISKNDKAINDFVIKVFGEENKAFYDLVNKSDKTYGDIIKRIDLDILKRKKTLEEIRFDITKTGVLSNKNANKLRISSQEVFDKNKAKADTLFSIINDDLPIDIKPIYEKSKSILSNIKMWDQEAFPAIISDIVKKIESRTVVAGTALLKGEGINTAIPLGDFRSLYTEINKALTATRHKPESNLNKSNQLRLLGDLKKTVREVLEKSKSDPLSGNSSTLYSDAIDFWRDEVAEPYQSGIMGDILQSGDRLGEYAKSADDIINMAFKNAKTEDFKAFVDVAKRGSAPYTALRDSILVFYKDFASKTAKLEDGTTISGIITKERHDAFLQKYGQLLEEVPEIRDSILDFTKTHKLANEAVLNRQIMKQRYEDETLFKLIQGRDPKSFFSKLRTPTGARDILKEAKKLGISRETVSRAAASELWKNSSKVIETGKGAVIDPNKMHKVLREQRGLELILTPSHMKSMEAALRAAEESNFKFNIDIKPTSGGIVGLAEDFFGRTAIGVNTELRAMRQNRLSPRHIVESIVLSAFATMNKKRVNMLLSEAMFDPDLSKIMERITRLQAKKGAVPKKEVILLWNRLDKLGKTALLGEFARNRASEEEQKEP